MASIIFNDAFLDKMRVFEDSIKELNNQKLIFLLESLKTIDKDSDREFLEWPTILVTAPDRNIMLQLNKYVASIPNCKFVNNIHLPFFSMYTEEEYNWRAKIVDKTNYKSLHSFIKKR